MGPKLRPVPTATDAMTELRVARGPSILVKQVSVYLLLILEETHR
jgi:hypothetical protein